MYMTSRNKLPVGAVSDREQCGSNGGPIFRCPQRDKRSSEFNNKADNQLMRVRQILIVSMLLVLGGGPARADWPQWGGPNRNFQVDARDLPTTWPDSRPKEVWRRRLGDGYSGIAAVEGVLYTMYRSGESSEAVIALDAETGQTRWEYSQKSVLFPGYNKTYGPGPHATPLVLRDKVYATGVQGTLMCVNRTTGKLIWDRELWEEFGGTKLARGYASSPIAHKQTVIVPSGGRGKSIIAFDQASGNVIWESASFKNSFNSPILINFDGSTQLVVFMARVVTGLDPDTGRVLWSHPHSTKYDINASTPIWGDDNILFISSAYDTGSRAIRLSRKNGEISTEELWYQRKMQIQHGTAIRLGDTVYGSSGDFGPAFLVSIDIHTGELLSRQRGFGKANLVAAGNQVIILDEDGQLAIAAAQGDSLAIQDSATILYDRSWTPPTLVGTTLYARNQIEIAAFDLNARP